MVVITWHDLVGERPAIRGPVALTIGTFDGVHRGHREILRRLEECADRGRSGRNMHRVLLTFRQHPRSVLTRQAPGTLTTLRQRRERFAALGVTHLVLIDFSAQFSRLSGREFVAALLRAMSLRKLVVGVDFRCGRGRDTDVDELQRLLASAGVQVVVVPPVALGDNSDNRTVVGKLHAAGSGAQSAGSGAQSAGSGAIAADGGTGVVSSTRIRASVRAGDFAATRKMMGEPFEVDLRGVVAVPQPALPPRSVPEGGSAVDRGATRWCIATEQLEQILPQPGAYAASVAVTGGSTISAEVEVAPGSVHFDLPGSSLELPGSEMPAGMDCIPLALRFHRRVAAHRKEHPISADGVQVASRVQE